MDEASKTAETTKGRSRKTSRRTFLALCGGGVIAGVAGAKCVSRPKPNLAMSMGQLPVAANSQCQSDPEALKDLEQLGIRHMGELDKLPWFEKDDAGELRLKKDVDFGPIVDTHSHVGWAFGLARSVDMARQNQVKYFYDFRQEQDFLFEQIHPTPKEAASMTREDLEVFLQTPQRNRTQTAANLSAEMDRMNYGGVVLLPIAIPHQVRHTHDTLRAARLDSRFVALGGIYPKPWGPAKVAELERQVREHGIKGVKYHPVFQLLAPDDPDMMKLFEWCQDHDILVYAHTGYTGREPGFMKSKSEPERFAKALQTYPKLRCVFAHTGIRRADQALSVARRFEDQVWLDISGQAAPAIAYILQRYDTDKVMFGSDWPFYPLSVMIARSLVATESFPQVREKFFGGNAKRLLNLA